MKQDSFTLDRLSPLAMALKPSKSGLTGSHQRKQCRASAINESFWEKKKRSTCAKDCHFRLSHLTIPCLSRNPAFVETKLVANSVAPSLSLSRSESLRNSVSF